jgi:hypothetical protein
MLPLGLSGMLNSFCNRVSSGFMHTHNMSSGKTSRKQEARCWQMNPMLFHAAITWQ